MRKRISLLVLTLTLFLSGLNVQAVEKGNKQMINKYVDFFLDEIKGTKSEESISSLKESLDQLLKDVKPEDTKKIIDFIEDKIEEGKWDSEKGIKEAIEEAEKIVKKAEDNKTNEPNKENKLKTEVTPLINVAKQEAKDAAEAYKKLGAAVAELEALIAEADGKEDNNTEMIQKIEDARTKVEEARQKALDAERDAEKAREKARAALKKAIEIANTPEDKIKPDDTDDRLG